MHRLILNRLRSPQCSSYSCYSGSPTQDASQHQIREAAIPRVQLPHKPLDPLSRELCSARYPCQGLALLFARPWPDPASSFRFVSDFSPQGSRSMGLTAHSRLVIAATTPVSGPLASRVPISNWKEGAIVSIVKECVSSHIFDSSFAGVLNNDPFCPRLLFPREVAKARASGNLHD